MVTLHCTGRVLRRFRFTTHDSFPPSTTRLGAWYANLLNFGPQRHVLCVSECGLLPVLVPARNAEFPQKLPFYVSQVLRRLDIPQDLIEVECAEMTGFVPAKTRSRTILGVMHDFAIHATYCLDDLSPLATSLQLARTPSGPLNYDTPIDRACEAFDVTPPPFSV